MRVAFAFNPTLKTWRCGHAIESAGTIKAHWFVLGPVAIMFQL